MTIAAGFPILASDVAKAISHAQASAAAAQASATAAAPLAAAANTTATTALQTANTAAADAASAKSEVGGLQQQITNNVATNDAGKTSIDTQTAELGALANRIAALEAGGGGGGGGGGGDPPPVLAVPNTPTNPTSTATTSASVSLSATAPAIGAAATSYTVRRSAAGAGTYTDAGTVTAPTVAATLTGLTPSTSYDILVRADGTAGAGGQTAPINRSTIAGSSQPPPTTTDPGPGPAFRFPAGNRTIVGGQRVSVNMDISDNQPGWPGRLLHGIKPYFYSGIWRNAESGPGFFSGGTTVGWLEQGSYLYDDDIARIYSADGLPPVWDGAYPINGSRLGIRWWTYGTAANGGVDLELFTEPGLDNAPQYDIINDYKGPTRGDTFRLTPNVFGAGRCIQTSWGSYFDLTQDSRGPAGFGLGWVAFRGYSMTMDQIGNLGGF